MIKHVVIAGNFQFPSGSASASRIRNFAFGLAENGVRVHILAMAPMPVSEPNSGPKSFNELITYECLANWQTADGKLPLRNRVAQKPGWFLKAYGSAWSAYWKLKKKIERGECDLLFVYGRSAVQLSPLVRLSRVHNIVTLIDVDEIRDQFNGFGSKLSPIYWDLTVGEKWMPKLFNGSSLIANALVPIYKESIGKRYIIIPTIESWEKLPAAPVPRKHTFFRIMYLGAMSHRDAPHKLFELIKVLAGRHLPIRFDLVGKYHETPTGRKIFQQYSKDPAYNELVNWVGRVSEEELKARSSAADGFILPRRDELTERASFPTRLIEFLRQAKPVFAANVGDIGIYLRNGIDAMLFPPDDMLEAANMIQTVLSSPDRGLSMGLQGQHRGAECFDRKKHALRLIDFATHLQGRN